jgi:hypothetical protein
MKLKLITLTIAIAAALQSHARELRVAPASLTTECLFSQTCSVTVEDTAAPFSVTGNDGTGSLVTRTYVGESGTTAAGLTAYLFQLDLSGMSGTNPVRRIVFNFGPLVTSLDFDNNGSNDEAFVNARLGDTGTVSPAAATAIGNELVIDFGETGVLPGARTRFIGLVSTNSPATNNVHIVTDTEAVIIAARSPSVPPGLEFENLRQFIAGISEGSLSGKNERAKRQQRHNLTVLVNNAERASRKRYGSAAAAAILEHMAKHADGRGKDKIIDDPETTLVNEPADFQQLLQQAIATL